MSNQHPQPYVVTIHYHEKGLTDIMELNSAMINGGFKTALSDETGHPHELGTNSFGIVSALEQAEVAEQAAGLAEVAIGEKPTVKIATLEAFLSQKPENAG